MRAAAGDMLLAQIAAFLAQKRRQVLTPAAAQATRLRFTDAMACALAARASPVFVALQQASMGDGGGTCPVIGGGQASLDTAAFLNNVLIRQLDWNDTYIGKNGGHPSDFTGAALAAGVHFGRSGAELLHALDAGTHVMLDFCDAANALSRGWDPSTYVALGAVCTLALLAGLDDEQCAQAIAMTAVSAPMLLGRTGKVSSWKGLASAAAVRQSLFHVLLAKSGMSGPEPAFTGASGFATIVSGPLELELNARRDRSGDSHLKFWPAIYHAQGPIELCLALQAHFQDARIGIAQIEDIEISIYDFALRFAADTPDKWSPHNVETADHSIPFIAAHCLVRGEFGLGSLHHTLQDECVRALAQKVRVVADADFSAHWPAQTASRVRVKTVQGVFDRELTYIAGHRARPLDTAQVREKFLRGAQAGGFSMTDACAMLAQFEAISDCVHLRALF